MVNDLPHVEPENSPAAEIKPNGNKPDTETFIRVVPTDQGCVIAFNEPVQNVGFTATQARNLAAALVQAIKERDNRRGKNKRYKHH